MGCECDNNKFDGDEDDVNEKEFYSPSLSVFLPTFCSVMSWSIIFKLGASHKRYYCIMNSS